jgi:ketosteroid isomerase-like protein
VVRDQWPNQCDVEHPRQRLRVDASFLGKAEVELIKTLGRVGRGTELEEDSHLFSACVPERVACARGDLDRLARAEDPLGAFDGERGMPREDLEVLVLAGMDVLDASEAAWREGSFGSKQLPVGIGAADQERKMLTRHRVLDHLARTRHEQRLLPWPARSPLSNLTQGTPQAARRWPVVVRSRDTPFVASANLDLVRSIFAAWERGNFSSVEWAHPEIEFVIPDGPAPGRWTGLAGMAESWRDVLSAWEGYRVGADEYRELDGLRILVITHRFARGKASGLELIETQGANVFHVRSGKVTKLVAYFDRDRALADLGLAPEAPSAGSAARAG